MDGHRQLTREVRVESNTAGPLHRQAGVYLFDEKYVIDNLDHDPATHAVRGEIPTRQSNKAYAGFGSINYDLSRQLQLRAGLRSTHDKKHLATTGTVNAPNGTTADTNLYTRYANGLRASSIQNASAFGPRSQAGPESINSYEVGFKSELRKRTLRLSGSLFSYTVKDLQLTAVGGSVNATRLLNASKASGNDAELNLEALVTPDVLVTFGGSLEVSGAFPTVLDPLVNGIAMIDGNALPNAPKWTYDLTARWSIPLASGDEVYVYADWAYRSKVNFFLYEATEFTGKALTEGGLRGGYIWGNGKYEAAGFVRNITRASP